MAVLSTRRPRGSFAVAQLATLVALAAAVVTVIIGAAILLAVYAPHTGGQAVSWIRQAAAWLTTPFHHLVNANGNRRIWLNWGIAAAVYLVAGGLIARLIRSSARY